MKKYVVVYKRKKYIKVATAIGSKFYRILVVIYLLFSCIAINAKTIRVFTGNIQRVENGDCSTMLKYMDIKEILMCSGLRKTIEDVSFLFHRLNISELHSFITMNK